MYRILTVCTGNICRSPALEALLRHRLDASVTVASAGTHGLPAWPVSEPMAALLTADGVPCDGFASRPLTAAMADEADLVLALGAEHRRHVLDLAPRTLRRTLLLGELARLAPLVPPALVTGDDDAARLRALVPAAAARRHQQPGGHADDVPDPYRRGDAAYAASYAQMVRAVDDVVGALRR